VIAPRFDPTGNSAVHSADSGVKLLWLICLTLIATISNKVAVETLLLVQCLVLFILVARGKRTPVPPVLWMVALLGVLLFCLNLLFTTTALRNWGEGSLARPLADALAESGVKALRISATALAIFVFTLSTVPRDLARRLETFRIPSWFTEPLAITLRFLPVFEVNLRMLIRVLATRMPRVERFSLSSMLRRFGMLIKGTLVLGLSQANVTSASLSLRHFHARVRRQTYLPATVTASTAAILTLTLGTVLSLLWK
jgi:energy-coupling factor transporter transmembrane protein EcfT